MPRWAMLFVVVLIAVDQISKRVMLNLVFDPPSIISVTSFFNLVPVWNPGISFGLLGGAETSRWILVALALAIIVFSSPLWLIAAIGIRASSRGSIFFKQSRSGKHGKPFEMWKFRTMGMDAEEKKKEPL